MQQWKRVNGKRIVYLGMDQVLFHLCFADDLLLFGPGIVSEKQALVMERILQHFCTVSGRRINIEKSQILFSANVDQATASGWLLHLASRFLSNFGKYLGMPTIHERAGKDTYYFLVEKVREETECMEGEAAVYGDSSYYHPNFGFHSSKLCNTDISTPSNPAYVLNLLHKPIGSFFGETWMAPRNSTQWPGIKCVDQRIEGVWVLDR